MNKNLIIGIIVVLVLLGAGYLLMTSTPGTPGGQATTTVDTTGTTGTTGDNGTTGNQNTPSAPTVVTDTGVAPTNSTAVVTGKVTPNGAPTSYWYEYGRTANLGGRTNAQSIGSGWSAIASPGYITGLAANTTYYFRLVAQNSQGTTNGTTYSFSTNNNPPGQGTAPAASTNSATAVARATATLNAHVNPHSSQTTYWFEYGQSNDFGSVTGFQSAGSGNTSDAVSADISGLAPATKYFFRINAQNQYGTVNGATQSFTTTGPAAQAQQPVVTTQVAAPVATTSATLRGTVNPSGAQTTYWFEYSTDSLLGSVLLKTTPHTSAGSAVGTASVTANVSNLASGTKYYYRIVAQNSAGTVRGDNQTFTTK